MGRRGGEIRAATLMDLSRREWLAALIAQEPVIRVDVRLVRVLATVKDPQGQAIGSVAREEFRVFDNDVAQEIAVFERYTAQPLSVAVLVDISASTAKDLGYQTDSVRRFLKALFGEGNPQDQASLYSFNWQVTQNAGFTRRFERLDSALRRLRPEAGTSLYDAVYLAARDLELREGRKVMITVTDGSDTTSQKKFREALEAAHRADAVIYPLVVTPIASDAGRSIGGENALAMFAAGTGGRTFYPSDQKTLDRAFAEVLNDLRTQYLLGFYPKNVPPAKDRFHRLRVEVQRPGLRVQTRAGYYGD
ncbi:MAG: VWA domain-containing protein [Bryobacter sp.]|nr:VWA domain-containing protein [Bryobacter sp.]